MYVANWNWCRSHTISVQEDLHCGQYFVHIFNKKKSSFEQIAICEILFLLIAFYYFPFDCLMLMSMRHRILCIHLFFFYLFFSKVPLKYVRRHGFISVINAHCWYKKIEKYFHALDFDCIKHIFTPSCLPLEFRQMVVHQTQAMYKYTN